MASSLVDSCSENLKIKSWFCEDLRILSGNNLVMNEVLTLYTPFESLYARLPSNM